MQKVVGSSPIIRFAERPGNAGLLLSVLGNAQRVWQQNGNGSARVMPAEPFSSICRVADRAAALIRDLIGARLDQV